MIMKTFEEMREHAQKLVYGDQPKAPDTAKETPKDVINNIKQTRTKAEIAEIVAGLDK